MGVYEKTTSRVLFARNYNIPYEYREFTWIKPPLLYPKWSRIIFVTPTPPEHQPRVFSRKELVYLFLAATFKGARRTPDNLGVSHAWIMGNLANAPHLAPRGFAWVLRLGVFPFLLAFLKYWTEVQRSLGAIWSKSGEFAITNLHFSVKTVLPVENVCLEN